VGKATPPLVGIPLGELYDLHEFFTFRALSIAQNSDKVVGIPVQNG
jgi:hypothetical protein